MTVKVDKKETFLQKTSWPRLLSFFYLALVFICAVCADIIPLSFLPQQLDLQHLYQPPFYWQAFLPDTPVHWLGTDNLGRDVLANLLYGCRTALLMSIPAMTIAIVLGIVLGGLAGFYGDKALRFSIISLFVFSCAGLLAYFYGFYIRQYAWSATNTGGELFIQLIQSMGIAAICIMAGVFISRWLNKIITPKFYLSLPVDLIIMKCIELLTSIPRIILILCLAAYTRPTIISLIVLTGFTYWTEPARLIRAELLRIKTLNYIESARALGLQNIYIFIRHALPNSLSSIIVAATYSIAGLISLESTLSFLNIGVPADTASWGKMVASAKSNFSAWWLVVFPGLALCTTVLALQTLSGWLIEKLNPRNR